MNNLKPYVNIHTHQITGDGSISILNLPSDHFIDENLPLQIYFSAGLHPWSIKDMTEQTERVSELAHDPRVLAIGECGFDKNSRASMTDQEKVFEFHVVLSELVRKPLIIHCVKAHQLLIHKHKEVKPTMPWIIHGFNNSPELGTQCLAHGMILSFGKSLFNQKSGTIALIKDISTDNFFLETDDSNWTIADVYERCSSLRGVASDDLKDSLYRNFGLYFKFTEPSL
jgi:TatD DNase family protein